MKVQILVDIPDDAVLDLLEPLRTVGRFSKFERKIKALAKAKAIGDNFIVADPVGLCLDALDIREERKNNATD